ncbi:MAG: putative entry exclusion protein TrbK-alt [Xanthobacteraceae bacterium]|nr:putative entry exclusion protein TrbK-alt [Xanthobacteraceae bacterium]
MDRYLTPRRLARIAALGSIVLIAAWAGINSRRGEDPGTAAPVRLEEVDALVSELARCRTVTLDDTASLENCRRVWTESHRQFFGPTRTTSAPVESGPNANGSGKNQDRVSPGQAEHQQNGGR